MKPNEIKVWKELFGNHLQEELTGRNPANNTDFLGEENILEKGFQKLKHVDKKELRPQVTIKDYAGKLILTITEYDIFVKGKYKRTVIACEYTNGKSYLTEVKKMESSIWGNLLIQKGISKEVNDLEKALQVA